MSSFSRNPGLCWSRKNTQLNVIPHSMSMSFHSTSPIVKLQETLVIHQFTMNYITQLPSISPFIIYLHTQPLGYNWWVEHISFIKNKKEKEEKKKTFYPDISLTFQNVKQRSFQKQSRKVLSSASDHRQNYQHGDTRLSSTLESSTHHWGGTSRSDWGVIGDMVCEFLPFLLSFFFQIHYCCLNQSG